MGVQLAQDPGLGRKHLIKSVTTDQIGVEKQDLDDDLDMEGGQTFLQSEWYLFIGNYFQRVETPFDEAKNAYLLIYKLKG